VAAQSAKNTSKSKPSSNENDIGQLMFDYSRPGKYHQLLANLVGTWNFEGQRFPVKPDSIKLQFDFFGTHVRRPFAEGRYFIVDITMGDSLHKQMIPVQDEKTKEVIGKGVAIEGYNNVKKKFEQAYITNHIGSDIVFWEGTYDSTTRTISFYAEQEIIPGIKDKLLQRFTINSKNDYTVEYYNEENGKYIKNAEVNFKRLK
jgi:hypothetical protein